jgi:hypothetical protein
MLVFLLACSSEGPPPPPPSPAVAPAPAPSALATWADQAEPPVRPVLDPARPGPVLLRVERGRDRWIARVDGTGITRVDPPVRDIQRAPDGSVWGLARDEAVRLDGDERIALDCLDDAQQVALDARGRVWLASRDAVGRWDGTHCVTTAYDTLSPPPKVPQDLVVDGDDVWLSHLDGLARFDGTTWTSLPRPGGDIPPVPGDLRVGPDGAELATSGGWFRWVDGAWRSGGSQDASGGFDVQGTQRIVTSGKGISWQTTGDAERRLSAPDGMQRRQAATVDTSGRPWVASDIGLHVWEADATTPTRTWWSSSDPLLTGRVVQAFAVGAGPTGLPEAGPPRHAAVSARFVRGDAPFANADVELCPRPGMLFSGESPCDGSAYRVVGRTGADGSVTFPEVPIAPLQVTFRTADGWKSVLGRAWRCCEEVQGASMDLGDVTLPE